MRKIISESIIDRAIKMAINEMLGEVSSIPYDPNFFDGIEKADVRSINLYIMSMIPEGNRVSPNSPYKSIRQLVLYFSNEGATKHGGRLTKDIVNFMLKNKELSSKIYAITQADKRILNYIYGKNRLSGKPLMQQIVWELDEILEQLGELSNVMNSANFRNYFNNTEAMEGSADGKRVGLAQILMGAYMGANQIKTQMKKMENMLAKQDDPLTRRIR